MSGFILRILFSGLIVFVPSQDGHQVTVLLLNVPHNHQISDGSTLPDHKPLLIARAGGCTGDCTPDDADVAKYLFADKSVSEATDALGAAAGDGSAWDITGSEITLQKGSSSDPDLPQLSITRNVRDGIIPTTSSEREDFDWVADLTQICGDGCPFDSSIHDATPPSSLIAARFVLHSGNLFTYSLARIGTNVTPVHFKRLDGTGSDSSYSQAVATWVAADIEVSGDSVEFVSTKYSDSSTRTMTLTPDENGKMEVAVINLPPYIPLSAPFTGTPGIGRHFETYYDLAEDPPTAASRMVPYPGAASGAPSYSTVTWASVHPQQALWSDLLSGLRFNVGRTMTDQLLCPPSQGQP
jgi:hypothetical protein